MDDKAQVIKHLEMIQAIVSRLAFNSFLVKGWSITILAAALLFIANTRTPEWVVWCFAIPLLGFWGLDAYFLWQERMFRALYNKVRQQETTDFAMPLQNTGKRGYFSVIFSRTLLVFYAMQLTFIAATFTALLLTK